MLIRTFLHARFRTYPRRYNVALSGVRLQKGAGDGVGCMLSRPFALALEAAEEEPDGTGERLQAGRLLKT